LGAIYKPRRLKQSRPSRHSYHPTSETGVQVTTIQAVARATSSSNNFYHLIIIIIIIITIIIIINVIVIIASHLARPSSHSLD
jgi:hypothetical protein